MVMDKQHGEHSICLYAWHIIRAGWPRREPSGEILADGGMSLNAAPSHKKDLVVSVYSIDSPRFSLQVRSTHFSVVQVDLPASPSFASVQQHCPSAISDDLLTGVDSS